MSIDWIEGATHYHENTRCFYKKVEGVWNLMSDGMDHGRSSSLYNGEISEYDLIERPKQPQAWSGPEDGLPPVNERVEVLWSSITGEYVDALILAHDEDRAVFRFVTGDRKGEYQADKLHFSGKFPNFRAIKTQKQIADEKRETAIREFMDVVGIDCRVTASKAVDAGFKREVK